MSDQEPVAPQMSPDIETTVLENLDFEPSCESGIHDTVGSGKVITLINVKNPCCGKKFDVYACVGCTHFATTSTHYGQCMSPDCGQKWLPYKACVEKVNYL